MIIFNEKTKVVATFFTKKKPVI